MSDARELILARIDTATGTSARDPSGQFENLSRQYIRHDSLSGSDLIHLFEHRLIDYGARIFHSSADKISGAIAEILTDRQAKRMLVPVGLPPEWLPSTTSFTPDTQLSYDNLDSFDGVLTGATVAIAATGSIVLQHGPGQGRRALTLIPDYHLCVLFAHQVVETVPAAMARLDITQPTTFISGPSATADIEMTRIKGVHGPRFLDVVFI